MPDWREHIEPRLASLHLEPAREAEIIEELSLHLDERYAELLQTGTTPEDALRTAIDELVDPVALPTAMRTLRQAHASRHDRPAGSAPSLFADAWHDIRTSVRALAKERLFTAAAVLTLALGVGGTVAMFSVIYSVLLKPLPYQDPDRLVRIVHVIGGIRQPFFSDAIFQSYVAHSQTLADVGVWSPGSTATITGHGDPEEVREFTASRSVLTTLGVQPALGRWFSTAEDSPTGPAAVMLSHGYWQRQFGADPTVLSRSLIIDGRPHPIVGIMPARFRFAEEFEILRPLRVNTARPAPVFRLVGIAKLKPGVTLEQANADVVRILHAWFESQNTPADVRARWVPALQPLKDDVIGDVGSTLWVLMGAIGIVLLMVCANVANLLLVRANGRRRELAIRAALGASGMRIARQLLVETLLLALVGGAMGLLFAYVSLRALLVSAPANLPRLSEIAIDPVTLSFAATISLLSGLLFASIAIAKHARPRLEALGGARSAGHTRERQRSQQVLVTAQMALALMLLVSAGLMIRSFQALRHLDPGFSSPSTLQTFNMRVLPAVARESEHVTRLQQELVERIATIPGVSSVAFSTRMPMGTDRFSSAQLVKGRVDDGRTPPNHQVKVISPGLFRTQGTSIVAGRDYTWDDIYSARNIAIVSENLARELWGAPSAAVGQYIREYYDKQSPWREVVGVVRDVYDDGLYRSAPTTVYYPAQPVQRAFGISGFQARRVTIAIRSERAGTPAFLQQVRAAMSAVNPSIPLAQVGTLDEAYRRSMARTSFTLLLLAVAGAVALLLGMCGIYGVISYAVSQRRREIGIRLALGAPQHRVRRLFVRRGLTMGGLGLVAGLGGAWAATRLMESVLFGVTPLDPLTFASMPVVLAAAAMLASYLPARAATRVDPVETMRAE